MYIAFLHTFFINIYISNSIYASNHKMENVDHRCPLLEESEHKKVLGGFEENNQHKLYVGNIEFAAQGQNSYRNIKPRSFRLQT